MRPPRGWDAGRLAATALGMAAAALVLWNVGAGRAPALAAGPDDEAAPASGIVRIDVDVSADRRRIDPAIYGMAFASESHLRDLRLGSNRWGGNPNTRYNWEGNFWNKARDWKFWNYADDAPGDRTPAIVADRFVAANRAAGVPVVFTIPTIGWVARNGDNSTYSVDVPPRGGLPVRPGSEAIRGYDPAANRKRTSVRSFARKRGAYAFPPDLGDGVVYQDEFVHHLVRKFGHASEGGVRYYAMDNEPDLWAATHTDVHPVAPGYDELLSRFLDYGTAVKAVDPSASITGPVSWGWTGYVHSPRDAVAGNWGGRPDRRAHGDMEFVPWFLSQVRRHDARAGRRTLDVLDVHFYPQAAGVFQGETDALTNALRLRSTRALWDPAYRDESWIGEAVRLVPRLREWARRHYPGTKVAITEWNWGADGTVNGGLAVAECLGIFGREGLDLANYWTVPAAGSPGYNAFKLYRNPDGRGRGFGDVSVRARSQAPSAISCFASIDTRTGDLVTMLLNKLPDRSLRASMALRALSWRPAETTVWQLDGAGALREGYAPIESGGRYEIGLAPSTATLVRYERPAAGSAPERGEKR
ncbi:MAG: glycoside hydrolase family 44 protein [Chthonomonadales bacterium]|nr:glycoside hydrolase family 44 protein [Chthonomonadales bacterium]